MFVCEVVDRKKESLVIKLFNKKNDRFSSMFWSDRLGCKVVVGLSSGSLSLVAYAQISSFYGNSIILLK